MADAKVHILVLEDDPRMAAEIVRGLTQASFEVELTSTGLQARDALMRTPAPDLMVCDLMVPELSGLELLEHAQSRTNVPIIVLTAATSLEDRVRCFRLGAVDFLPKPFWMEELIERIRVRLRKAVADEHTTVRWANAVCDLDARRVSADEVVVALTKTEFNVLAYLVARPERAITRAQLAESCLPDEAETDARIVDTYVARIRKKLGTRAGAHVMTVWGVGYRFSETPPAP